MGGRVRDSIQGVSEGVHEGRLSGRVSGHRTVQEVSRGGREERGLVRGARFDLEKGVTGGRGGVVPGRAVSQNAVQDSSTGGRGWRPVLVEQVSSVNIVGYYLFC